ncbi:hypothetical protein [Frigidibacter oleivorans]|uniref:hypothetical protein n=1 Tax=Frigidibacter oleivorans TaxID=2487129 RepID=UPI000F8F6E6F|nr:hypothetical protein [Frigidibacter oleivorans]
MFERLKVGRVAWWLSLILFVGGLLTAYIIHLNGLSFWLQRASFWHSTAAVLIASAACGLFFVASSKRIQDMRAPKGLIWWAPLFPVWILLLGIIPGSTEQNPEPFKTFKRRARLSSLVFAGFTVVAVTGYIFIRTDISEISVTGIENSDDVSKYEAQFTAAANSLIAERRCSAEDFEEMGGWVKSTTHRDKPIYFTYCGGMTADNRIYLDVSTGAIFR